MTKNKKSNIKPNFGNVHIIPFDMGFMFYDVYTPSYLGNYYLWQEFLQKIKNLLKKGESGEKVLLGEEKLSIKNAVYKDVSQKIVLSFKNRRPVFSIKKKDNKKVNNECFFKSVGGEVKNYLNTFDDCLCEIKLEDNLYCFILKSGIAVFVVGCFDNEGLDVFARNSKDCDDAIKMRFQNEIINRALLLDELNPEFSTFLSFDNDKTGKFDNNGAQIKKVKLSELIEKDKELTIGCKNLDKVIHDKRKLMILFKIWCWKTLQQIVKKINSKAKKHAKWENKRPHSSKPYFKQFGFSMSANFIINKKFNDSKLINYLQDRSLSYHEFDEKNSWDEANGYYKKVEYINVPQNEINTVSSDDTIKVPSLNIVKMSDFNISFSSNTICIQPKEENDIKSLDDFFKKPYAPQMTDLLFAEIDVITKWFNADNCINNDFEKPMSSIQDLQTIQGQIEYYSAELDNPTSSKVESLYLMYKRRIVDTTKVKELYASISEEIKILKAKKIEKINEASDRRSKFGRVIRAVVDCFIAGFTAAGITKTVLDVQHGSFNFGEKLGFWLSIIALILIRAGLGIADRLIDGRKQKDIKKR